MNIYQVILVIKTSDWSGVLLVKTIAKNNRQALRLADYELTRWVVIDDYKVTARRAILVLADLNNQDGSIPHWGKILSSRALPKMSLGEAE